MTSGTAHRIAVGWPSVSYEWWNAGDPDWALGGELVYGDWSGDFSDVEIGLGLNVPLRFHLHSGRRAAVAFRLTPGLLLAEIENGPNDRFVFGARGEIAVPVTISLHRRVNLVTGVNFPVSLMFAENQDPVVILPILGRIGVEITATRTLAPWLLLELGPALAFGDFGGEIEFALRFWLGMTVW